MDSTTNRRLFFIVNPTAGRSTHLSVLAKIEAYCREHGLWYDFSVTKFPKEATQLAFDAKDTYDMVVAVGGDGTVNEVGQALVGTQSPLGIIPIGSGNDFAHQMGYTHSLEKTLNTLRNAKTKIIDVIQVNGDRYALNAFGVGFDAVVADRFRQFRKYVGGFPAYLFSVLRSLPGFVFPNTQIVLSGSRTIISDTLLVAVCNGTTYGGGFRVTPSAKMDDGLITICIVKKTTKFYALRKLYSFTKGTHIDLPEVEILTAEKVTISVIPETMAQIDGELIKKEKAFLLQIIPQSLNVIYA